MLPRPFRHLKIKERELVEKAFRGEPPTDDDPMDCWVARLSNKEWHDYQEEVRRTYPVEWETARKYRDTTQRAWEIAQDAYDRGEFALSVDMMVVAAIHEVQGGRKDATVIELLTWAALYRIALLANPGP
jgi:hypothetical protein